MRGRRNESYHRARGKVAHDTGTIDRFGLIADQTYMNINIANLSQDACDERHFVAVAVDDAFFVDGYVLAALGQEQLGQQPAEGLIFALPLGLRRWRPVEYRRCGAGLAGHFHPRVKRRQ